MNELRTFCIVRRPPNESTYFVDTFENVQAAARLLAQFYRKYKHISADTYYDILNIPIPAENDGYIWEDVDLETFGVEGPRIRYDICDVEYGMEVISINIDLPDF